ncbi:Anaerobic sulfite reductase subunit B [Salinivirga cyanobacteriivorans]|uniref:Anaerobic sulfite reductase subunit B n=1 Tax=Salinivirga cyanobacteriivorans TaxID=1307839 RepID=A0A0S2HY49_9BACT|nr:FAD/NAD(P)-binding protein [Salinivirga cyanobacteriivorans]ALO14916.1 Anaerobic sulfite reductase subunit B [Salinivirga cyanobacteriivorans]
MYKFQNIYKPVKAKLTEVIEESPTIKSFVLRPERAFPFKTGQFVELTLDGLGEAPFTPSSSPLIDDEMQITIMKAGYVTERIHKLKPGVTMGIRGPYGRGYPVEEFYNKEVLILGGGCGFAPLRSLLYNLKAEEDKIKKLIFCYGSKTPQECIYKPYIDELRAVKKFEVMRSVDEPDDTWAEEVGVVTKLLDKVDINIKNSISVVCGPPIMMKFGTFKLLDMGFPDNKIYLSMEKNMSCGFGKCGHCMMGKYFVCKDGPVFTYEEIKNEPDIWK